MKGIIFNLLEDVVTSNHGLDAWDQLLAGAGLNGAYTSLGSYPDEQIRGLVGAGSRNLGLTAVEVSRWFGQQAIPLLFERYPGVLQFPVLYPFLRVEREPYHSS